MRWIKAGLDQKRIMIFQWDVCLHISIQKNPKVTDESKKGENDDAKLMEVHNNSRLWLKNK